MCELKYYSILGISNKVCRIGIYERVEFMGNNIQAYRKYVVKQKLLGIEDFEFEVDDRTDTIIIKDYIGSSDVVVIPSFVSKVYIGVFNGVNRNLKVKYTGNQIKNMDFLFYRYEGRELDLTQLYTTGVESMIHMFGCCRSLKKIDISNLDTSKVKSMRGMFYGCSSLEGLDLSNINTSKVEDIHEMFGLCGNLKYINISNFNTSRVKRMDSMFMGCYSLQEVDLSNFGISNLSGMNRMIEEVHRIEGCKVVIV